MIVINYTKKLHQEIVELVSIAILNNKVVAMPTDTSYCLAVLASSNTALERMYKIKGRSGNKPVSIFPSSLRDLSDICKLTAFHKKLIKQFWPGVLTLVLPLLAPKLSNVKFKEAHKALQKLSANSGFLGFRVPKNEFVCDVLFAVQGAITATSANVAGKLDCYSGDEIIEQYKSRKEKPDILIYIKPTPSKVRKKPSTVVKITNGKKSGVEIVRNGPISLKQILSV